MCPRALRGEERAWGVEHTSTLDTINNLGLLYAAQGNRRRQRRRRCTYRHCEEIRRSEKRNTHQWLE
jgi:hypothetical protein